MTLKYYLCGSSVILKPFLSENGSQKSWCQTGEMLEGFNQPLLALRMGKQASKPRNVANHLEAGVGKKMASPQSPERKTALLMS